MRNYLCRRVSNVVVNGAPVILDNVPSLAVSNSDNALVTLLWPGPATGFKLYGATNLASATWQQITNGIANSNGVMQITLPATNASYFFRLSSP
jgi:hypothetical protein